MELTNAELVNAVANHVDGLSPEQVHTVLAALVTIKEGDPVGTVRRDTDTGKVAHRVLSYGVAQWRISGPDGEQYNDLQPTLAWPTIYSPEESGS